MTVHCSLDVHWVWWSSVWVSLPKVCWVHILTNPALGRITRRFFGFKWCFNFLKTANFSVGPKHLSGTEEESIPSSDSASMWVWRKLPQSRDWKVTAVRFCWKESIYKQKTANLLEYSPKNHFYLMFTDVLSAYMYISCLLGALRDQRGHWISEIGVTVLCPPCGPLEEQPLLFYLLRCFSVPETFFWFADSVML